MSLRLTLTFFFFSWRSQIGETLRKREITDISWLLYPSLSDPDTAPFAGSQTCNSTSLLFPMIWSSTAEMCHLPNPSLMEIEKRLCERLFEIHVIEHPSKSAHQKAQISLVRGLILFHEGHDKCCLSFFFFNLFLFCRVGLQEVLSTANDHANLSSFWNFLLTLMTGGLVKSDWVMIFIESSLLSGSFPVKSSPFSPTKMEELTAGSDEKRCVYLFSSDLSVLLSLSEKWERTWLMICMFLVWSWRVNADKSAVRWCHTHFWKKKTKKNFEFCRPTVCLHWKFAAKFKRILKIIDTCTPICPTVQAFTKTTHATKSKGCIQKNGTNLN